MFRIGLGQEANAKFALASTFYPAKEANLVLAFVIRLELI